MKKSQSILKFTLMLFFAFTMFNCTKDDDEPVIVDGTYGTFTDTRDNKTYKTIKIGEQVWMAENLAYETTTGSWFYLDDSKYAVPFGRIYTWDAAIEAVPNGWHLASDEEWKQLEIAIGMSSESADGTNYRGSDEGTKLKSTSGWLENGNGSNVYHFGAIPSGFRTDFGTYLVMNWYAYFWTSTPEGNGNAWARTLSYNKSSIWRNTTFKGNGYSVRCIQD